MRRWADFEEAAPELAALGRERIERFGFVFLGTVRKDGGPRVSPVEAHFVAGHLAVVTIAGSLKALDLLRDRRAFLHTPVLDAQRGAPGEFKLRGGAVEARDRALRDAVADTVEPESGWRPPDDWRVWTMDVESAVFHAYDESNEVHRMLVWTPERGLERSTRTYL
jgi:Pyridoxamine 5'-phosphate oxidase